MNLDFNKVCKYFNLDLPKCKEGEYIDDSSWYISALHAPSDLKKLYDGNRLWWKSKYSLKDILKFNEHHLSLIEKHCSLRYSRVKINDCSFFDMKCEINNDCVSKIFKELRKIEKETLMGMIGVILSAIPIVDFYKLIQDDIKEVGHILMTMPTENDGAEFVYMDIIENPFLCYRLAKYIDEMELMGYGKEAIF